MLLNTLLILAVLAFGAYLYAPRIVRGITRWRRYNKLCRIRRRRQQGYRDQEMASFTASTRITMPYPGAIYPVKDIDGVVHFRSYGLTCIQNIEPLLRRSIYDPIDKDEENNG